MSLVDRPLFQRLAVVLQQLARTAGSKMPAWTGAVTLSLTAGWIAAFVYMHSTRRKWRAQQIRSTPQSVSLLKSITASCWREYDAEETGWLEPFEARACLARILQAIEEPHTIAQLSVLIAPQVDSALPTTSHESSFASSSSSPVSALQSEVCTEVRLILTKLLADLRNRDTLNVEFQSFLEHLEARPEKLPQTFTPPVGQKQRREKASATAAHIHANGNGSIASTTSDASHSSNEDHKSSSTSRTSSFSHSNVHSASAAAASLDVKIFRYEFTTAVVLWLEAQILRRIFTTEQGGTLAA